MATFEEKILAYLDGSLAGDERDEVLRAVSDSPERRALLDEHLRLQNIYTYAAKPTSAPLALQRELASQIPLLAIKLPYLAPVENRRKGAIAGFWSNTTSRISGIKTSWINTILVVLVALLAGGLWYLAKHSSSAPSISSSTGNSSNNLATPNGNAPSSNTPNNIAPTAPNNSHAGAIGSDTNRSASQHKKSTANVESKSAHAVAALHRNIEDRSYSASSPSMKKSSHSAPSNRLSNASEHSSANSAKATESNTVANIPTTIPEVNANNGAGANSQPTIPADTIAKQAAEPPHDISSVTSLRNTPIVANRILPQVIGLNEGEQSYVPVKTFARVVLRNSFSNTDGQSAYVKLHDLALSSQFSPANLEVGIDYQLTPWISIGAIGGEYQFAQWQQFEHSDFGGPLDKKYRDYSLELVSSPFAGLDVTYAFNPASDLKFAIMAGGGMAFIPNQSASILGLAKLIASFDLSSHLALDGSLGMDITSLGISSVTPSNLHTGTIGILNQGSPNGGPQTAASFSLGISYHP
jgi:hypothetical protein